jgi:hypothetical protein
MVGEIPVERLAQLILLLYLEKRGRRKARIHGRPRSDRKRRFLVSAVVGTTATDTATANSTPGQGHWIWRSPSYGRVPISPTGCWSAANVPSGP